MSSIHFAGRRISLPTSSTARIALGVALIVGGMLGFLPVLGFWMIPLGVVVLSIDVPWVRRRRRRFSVWWGRSKYNRWKSKDPSDQTRENDVDMSNNNG